MLQHLQPLGAAAGARRCRRLDALSSREAVSFSFWGWGPTPQPLPAGRRRHCVIFQGEHNGRNIHPPAGRTDAAPFASLALWRWRRRCC